MSIATLFFLLGLAPHGNFPFTPPPARQTPPAVQTTQATNDSIAQLEKAAMRGDARAQSQLAARYARGDGVPRDEEAALKWWQSAADLGDQEAAQALARYQRDSAPSEQHLPANVLPNPKFTQALRDLTAAAIALQQQAEAGDAHAQYALAERYRKDEAVGANGKHADYWLHRAAAQGEAAAASALRQLDAQQREVAEQQRRAEMGDSYAQFELSERYRWGKSIAQNQETANYWLQRAAEGDVVVAKYRLGIYYYEGAMGFRKDKAIARTWLDKAATQSPGTMQFQVGIFYFTHNEYDNARRWLQKVADSNDAAANIAASSLDVIDAIQGVTTTPQKKQKTP